MKQPLLLLLLTVFIYSTCHKSKEKEENPNNVLFEKIEYQIFNKTLIKDGLLKWKKVAYNTVKFNATVTLTEPVKDLWIRVRLYYKYREYQKYLIDHWVEYCKIMEDPSKHPLALARLTAVKIM